MEILKKLLFALAFTFIIGSQTYGQDGISFSNGNWQEILTRAEKENKLIFIDAYAEWCGPCKMMSRDVFPLESVGNFFNEKFINLKIDMEKGEGIHLARKYEISAYPSLLFVNGIGEVVHRAAGYHAPDMLISLGEAALDSDKNILGMKTRYKKGDKSPAFLRDYAMASQQALEPEYSQIAREYLSTQKNWNSEENMDFIFLMLEDIDSEMFRFLLNNKSAFETKYGERAVTGRIEQLIQLKIMNASNDEDLKSIENTYALMNPSSPEKAILRIRMGYYLQNEDWTKFAKASASYFKKYPSPNWEEMNEAAWIIFEEVEGVEENKNALKWAIMSIKLNNNYFNHDTAASLYYKLGKKKKALKYARKAIELAQKDGEDYSSTELLIQEISKR